MIENSLELILRSLCANLSVGTANGYNTTAGSDTELQGSCWVLPASPPAAWLASAPRVMSNIARLVLFFCTAIDSAITQ